ELFGASKAVDEVVGDPSRCEFGGEAFEFGADEVGVADFSCGRAANKRAAIRLQFDDAERLELTQRLAHGRPADAELGCDGILWEAVAARILTRHHPRLELRREHVDERDPRCRCQSGSWGSVFSRSGSPAVIR